MGIILPSMLTRALRISNLPFASFGWYSYLARIVPWISGMYKLLFGDSPHALKVHAMAKTKTSSDWITFMNLSDLKT